MEIYNPNDKIFKERNGRKAVWIDRELVSKIEAYAKKHSKCPQRLAEYILSLGVNTIEHYPQKHIEFDVDSL